jgi:hypothetical protein
VLIKFYSQGKILQTLYNFILQPNKPTPMPENCVKAGNLSCHGINYSCKSFYDIGPKDIYNHNLQTQPNKLPWWPKNIHGII